MKSASAPVSIGAPRIAHVGSTLLVESATEYQLVREARPGIVMFRYEGWTSMAHWEEARAIMEASIAKKGSLVIITNGELCEGYEPPVREAWSSWSTAHREQISAQHFVARSSMLRMGVQMSSMVSRTNVKLYREHAELEAVVATEMYGVDLAPIRTRQRVP